MLTETTGSLPVDRSTSEGPTLLSVAQEPNGGWSFGIPPVPNINVEEEVSVPDTVYEPIREPRSLHILRLTTVELIHLRDILSIALPPALEKTVSQALAEKENHVLSEANLWKKVTSACVDAEVPINDNAPDFIVAPGGMPEMRVFEISAEPMDQSDEGSGLVVDPFGSKKGSDD